MKINKYNALRFWEECYGSKQYAEDFHGNLMCKDGYGNNNFSVNYYGQEIYCGWNDFRCGERVKTINKK